MFVLHMVRSLTQYAELRRHFVLFHIYINETFSVLFWFKTYLSVITVVISKAIPFEQYLLELLCATFGEKKL